MTAPYSEPRTIAALSRHGKRERDVTKMPDLPIDGACRCGDKRFRVSAPPLLASVCHCTGCQRMTGSAFSTTLTVPEDGFAVTAGELVIGGIHGPDAHHWHCDHCKSWLYTTVEPSMGFVNVRATMLDGAAAWFVPYVETWTSEALPLARTPAKESFATQPEMADYEGIVGRFQKALAE